MKRTTGNLWTTYAQVKVIPTNGEYIDAGGIPPIHQAVMGAGVALQAKCLWPALSIELGMRLAEQGNHVYLFRVPENLREKMQCLYIITMPTKNAWKDDSILELIRDSCTEMAFLADALGLKDILLPAVGTGYGNLSLQDVEHALANFLDSRFTLVEL